MCEAFQSVLGCPVLEVPVAMDPPPAVESGPGGARPNVTYLGHTSQLKGFHLLPEIIRGALKFDPRPRFTVQIQNGQQHGFDPLLQWFKKQPASEIGVVEGALSPGEYYRLMAEADIVLLPYSPSYYGRCSSGVFAEAAALGKVIVVPDGTVAARQGREYDLGISVASSWTGTALAEAVGEAVRGRMQLRAKAAAAAARFRTEQSVENFWSRLLSAVREAGQAAA
jgi:glycosyltransferase involved in cell wall biosynthesis